VRAEDASEESVGRTLADVAPRAARPFDKEPRSAAEFYERGAYYFSSRNYDGAARDYRRALELQPDFAEAHNRLGRVLMMQGKFADAASEFRKAVEQKGGTYAAAQYNLGFALQKTNNLDDAVRAYEGAIESSGGRNPDAYFQMGIAQLNRNRNAEAATSLRTAIEQNAGRDPDAQHALGVALARQKDYEGAEAAFRAAIEGRGGDFADAHYNLGVLYQETKRTADAIREFESYLQQSPPGGDNRRRVENSLRDLRRALALEGRSP
jgi:tetratricopeptide (TPR) repeat protein